MKVAILGADGYIGWALTNYLLSHNHEVVCLDDGRRRRAATSLYPIKSMSHRIAKLEKHENFLDWISSDLTVSANYLFHKHCPDAIIHLAEQPSAPYSMRSFYHAATTEIDNMNSTLAVLFAMHRYCPDAHLIKLGTMGEYGTPDCSIPEGKIPKGCLGWSGDIEDNQLSCPMQGLQFPRDPGSFYHISKVVDSLNIKFACTIWGLRSTDIMQGVVFGHEYDTRFDYDQYFGTALNRFCAQAIAELPLTVYGSGNQKRGFLPLIDSIRCINLIMDNPPSRGEYRVINQFENVYSINELATTVASVAASFGLSSRIAHLDNPRHESEQHRYTPVRDILPSLGYEPTTDIRSTIEAVITKLMPYKNLVDKSIIIPTTTWLQGEPTNERREECQTTNTDQDSPSR